MTIDWKALAAPFAKNEVKTFKGPGGRQLSYITSRQVMNRLDAVLTPAGWYDEYHEEANGTVYCTLYILVDDVWIGKTDIGTESNIAEDKGAVSDAFKRAAVKWGIGRELYGDGTAYGNTPPPPPSKRLDTSGSAHKYERKSDKREQQDVPAANAAQGDEYDPAQDNTLLGQDALDKFKLWLATNDHANNPIEAGNRIRKALDVEWVQVKEYTVAQAFEAYQAYENATG
jgi:hypothetical protein